MRENLRSSTLSQRQKAKTDSSPENSGWGKKKLFKNSGDANLSKDVNVDSDKGRNLESQKDDDPHFVIEEKGLGLVLEDIDSCKDLFIRVGPEPVECGKDADVACKVNVSTICDGFQKTKALEPLISNGLDHSAKEAIESLPLTSNYLRPVEGTAVDGVSSPKDADEITNEEKKASSLILGDSFLVNDSKNGDADAVPDISRHMQCKGLRGRKIKTMDAPKEEAKTKSDADKISNGSFMILNDLEYGQDSVISFQERKVKSNMNEHMKNADLGGEFDTNDDANKCFSEVRKGRPGKKRKVLEGPNMCDIAATGCNKEERESSLVSIVLDSVKDSAVSNVEIEVEEETNKSQHLEFQKDADNDIRMLAIADINANDVEVVTGSDANKGRPGNVVDSLEMYDLAASGCDKEERVSPFTSSILDAAQDSPISNPVIKVEEETSGPLHLECWKDADVDANVVAIAESDAKVTAENCEGMPRFEKRKRGRKRKVESSQCYEDGVDGGKKLKEAKVLAPARILRSRTMSISGGDKVDDSRPNLSVLGVKINMKTDCSDQIDLHTEVDENVQLIAKPEKKRKRGRPPKAQGGNLASQFIQKNKHKYMMPKVTKRRGRPPKLHTKKLASEVIRKNEPRTMVSKKLKRRGRPPKVQRENLGSPVIYKSKLRGEKSSNQLLAKDIDKGPKSHKVQWKDELSEVITDNKLKFEPSEEHNDHANAEDATEVRKARNKINKGGLKLGKSNKEVETGRREEQQLVRDQIINMLMKAGWTVEYRPRLQREYMDAVYVDQKGKTHWSVTKAYWCLKKKIEDGVAESKEISAFTPISEEALRKLFRQVTKKRCDKGLSRAKDGNEAGKVTPVRALSKNKPGKKGKDGKRKGKLYSALRFGGKSSNMKTKGDKSCRERVKTVGSSLKGRRKPNQEGRQNRKPRLLARSSGKGSDLDCDGFTPYSGKRSLFSWMIDLGTLLLGGKVQYVNGRRKKLMLEGRITRDGIHCGCCDKIITISEFESHAGGKLGQPFNNIFLESGTSLLHCLLDSWRKEEESDRIRFNHVDVDGDDPNDDTCNICGDGGDLICCDSCPSTFHQSCLGIQSSPSGDWHCVYCSCKLCGTVAEKTPKADDYPDAFVSELLSCSLCEEKFHQSCIQGKDAINVDSSCPYFCGRKCQELFDQLQTFLGVRHDLEEGFSWTLLQRSIVSSDLSLDGASLKIECNSKLAVAFSIMDECFVPINDDRSGINMIHNVVYNCGSNFRRLNYSGFYTAILERGDEIISAASIRIHGNQLAEMPFIGTRHIYRRQGMCRRLLNAIELALGSLDVGKLVIPAIPELFQTWTSVFGFKPLEESRRQALKGMSMVVFPGTDMLQKPLLKNRSADGNIVIPAAVFDETTVECNSKLNEQSVCGLESKSSNARNPEQGPADSAGEGKEVIACEQTGELPSSRHGCSSPEEGSTRFKTEVLAHSMFGFLFPEKNVGGQGSEAISLVSSDAKSGIQSQHVLHNVSDHISLLHEGRQVSSESDAQFPGDCRLNPVSQIAGLDAHEPEIKVGLDENEQLGSSKSFPECITGPGSLASANNGLRKSLELQFGGDNDGNTAVKAFSSSCPVGVSFALTSEVARKGTFDLNEVPSAAQSDLQSLGEDSSPNGHQLYAKSLESSDSRSMADNAAVSLCNSDPCTSQGLVLV